MKCKSVVFTGHAISRIFERAINKNTVTQVLESGEIIVEYPEDKPFPSYLLLGFIDGKPFHVVVAVEIKQKICYIVTVYEPAPLYWDESFKKRRE